MIPVRSNCDVVIIYPYLNIYICVRVFGATMRITKEKTTAIRGELEPRLWAKLVEPVKPFCFYYTYQGFL